MARHLSLCAQIARPRLPQRPVQAARSGDAAALRLTRIELAGNLYFSSGFEAKGKVQLGRAIIRGNIDCRGGAFSVPHEISHDAAAFGETFRRMPFRW